MKVIVAIIMIITIMICAAAVADDFRVLIEGPPGSRIVGYGHSNLYGIREWKRGDTEAEISYFTDQGDYEDIISMFVRLRVDHDPKNQFSIKIEGMPVHQYEEWYEEFFVKWYFGRYVKPEASPELTKIWDFGPADGRVSLSGNEIKFYGRFFMAVLELEDGLYKVAVGETYFAGSLFYSRIKKTTAAPALQLQRKLATTLATLKTR